jgi:hypothetical protein
LVTYPTHRHVHDDVEVIHEDTVQIPETRAGEVRVSRLSWSPAQWVAALIGLFLIVLGAVALLRVGLDSLTGDTAVVWVFEHTALMGIIDLIMGVLFLMVAGSALNGRSGLITLGLLSLAFGLIVAIEPAAMTNYIGGGEQLGWLYAVLGGLSVITAFSSPTVQVRRATQATVVQTDL